MAQPIGSQDVRDPRAMHEGTGSMNQTIDGMGERARDVVRRAIRMAQDNPLLLALAAVAAGFLLGMAVPAARNEDTTFGSAEEISRRAPAPRPDARAPAPGSRRRTGGAGPASRRCGRSHRRG